MSDAVGMALGFVIALFCLGAVREVLGSGTLFGYSLFGPNFEPWVVMILPPGGFIMLGLLLLFFNWVKELREKAEAELAARPGVEPRAQAELPAAPELESKPKKKHCDRALQILDDLQREASGEAWD